MTSVPAEAVFCYAKSRPAASTRQVERGRPGTPTIPALHRDIDMTAASVPGKLARKMLGFFAPGRWVRQG